jgi:glyoxylate reductase
VRPTVHLTAPLPAQVEEAIGRDFDLVPSPVGADGVVTVLTVAVDDAWLAAAGPQLRVVANYVGESLDGKTVLVVGAGRIGRETARLVEAFGAAVAFAGRDDDLRRAVADADIVTIHTPLTDATRHLVDAVVLDAMKPTAILVNTSRGPVVDEQALVDALRSGSIVGAALDVYEHEPLVTEELLGLDNVVLSPHLGSATRDTRVAMGMLCVEALRAVLLEGRRPANAVD